MSKNQPLIHNELTLPDIGLIDSSEQGLSNAFLKAAQILYQHLERIKSLVVATRGFTQDPFNLAMLGLFSKMCKHYYSYVLLEIHQDQIGSQLLIEHLSEAAVTLVYLVEEGDETVFSEYIAASVHQARYLLNEVKQLQEQVANHSDLLLWKDKLDFIIKQQQVVERSLTTDSEACLWGPQTADTTAKRSNTVGLNSLSNPARQLALKVIPASWLDIQLNYLHSFAKNSRAEAKPGINFTCLRDASYLCLHATQTLLEEVNSHQNADFSELKNQQQLLNMLYEWFYNAHRVYQLYYPITIQQEHD